MSIRDKSCYSISHENDFILAQYNAFEEVFEPYYSSNTVKSLPNIWYFNIHEVAPARAFETFTGDFSFGTLREGIYCISTCHNGGITIWDPTIQNRPGDEFNWYGSGLLEDPFNPDPGSVDALTFGIALAWGCGDGDENGPIHVYIGDGFDGLLYFDFSGFLSPFDTDFSRNLDELWWGTEENPDKTGLLAYDVRLLHVDVGENEQFLIFTSWLNHRNQGRDGRIALTVHEDETPGLEWPAAPVNGDRITCITSASLEASEFTNLHLEVPSPNPSSGTQRFEVSSNIGRELTLRIFDLAGRIIFEDEFITSARSTQFIWCCIDMSGDPVPSGSYFVEVTSKDGMSSDQRSLVLY